MKTTIQGDELIISSTKVNFVFNKNSGLLTSYKVDGTEYFKDGFGIQPNFWRAPNDNDYGNSCLLYTSRHGLHRIKRTIY